jgi:alkaline phosphatase D
MSFNALSRRHVLRAALTAAAAGAAAPWAGSAFARTPVFLNDPFSLGVASGDPTPDGAVIWTRLAPSPIQPDGGMPEEPVELGWEVAADEGFRRILAAGRTLARPDNAHCVHVELRGLPAGTPLFYRFHAGEATSPTGRFATAPAYGRSLDSMRISWASCQHYEQGFFTPYRDMVAQNPDLVIHTGDYIYESSWGPQVRRHVVPEPMNLADYRAVHALYKLDPDLQAAHAAAPWLFIWDDHEVDNDYAGDISEEVDVDPADFYHRRVAAYRAFFEHQPLRRRSLLTPEGRMRIWGSAAFGDLAEVFLTDGRQFRSPMACPTEFDRGGNIIPESCPDLADESRSYLGARQERWLNGSFGRGPARWNIMVQPTLFSPFAGASIGDEPAVWSDGWDGYPAARARLTSLFARREGSNPIVLGGDTHCYWVSDVKADYRDETAAPVGAEFVTTSITSLRGGYERISADLPLNPHIKHFDNREHGYGLLTLGRDRAEVDLRVVATPRDRFGSQARFIVEAGRPGVQPA